MSRAECVLAWIFRIEALVLLCALPAVVMPTGLMAEIHRALGMGEFPRAPLVEYLTRSLSLLYASWAPLLFLVANDLRRYLPIVWLLSWFRPGFGLAMVVLDLYVGLPMLWVAFEGPPLVAVSLVGLWLVWQIQRETNTQGVAKPDAIGEHSLFS